MTRSSINMDAIHQWHRVNDNQGFVDLEISPSEFSFFSHRSLLWWVFDLAARQWCVCVFSATSASLIKSFFTVKQKLIKTFISLSSILDGEWEAQWLVAAGFPQLTRAFEQVRKNWSREISTQCKSLWPACSFILDASLTFYYRALRVLLFLKIRIWLSWFTPHS